MKIEELHRSLERLEGQIRAKGLQPEARAYVNWIGCEVQIHVVASERFDEKGFWQTSRSFEGDSTEIDRIVREANEWVAVLPNEEDRAIEFLIQKINKLAGELPKGGTEIAQMAWQEIHRMLIAKAEQIAKNGLPSPARIQQLDAS